MTIKLKNPILEDLGSIRKYKSPILTPNIQSSNRQELQGVNLFNFNFQGWQQNVIRNLNNNQNIYVVASPGSGKTAPVMYSWFQNVLNVNPSMLMQINPNTNQLNTNTQQIDMVRQSIEQLITSSRKGICWYRGYFRENLSQEDVEKGIDKLIFNYRNLPQMLYLCPVRQLVYGIQKEIREYLSQIILHLFKIIQNSEHNDSMQPALMRLLNQNIYNRDLRPLINERRQHIAQYQSFGNVNQFDTGDRSIKILNKINIIDQQIFEIIGTGIKRFIDRHLLHMVTKVDHPPSVGHSPMFTVAIYESGLKLSKKLRNIHTVIIDEAHLVQKRSSDQNSRSEQIVKNVYPIIKNIESNQSLILLSGTVNPTSATNLCNFIESCLKTPITQISGQTRNPSNINIVAMNDLAKEQTLVKLLINPKENGNAIIVFSKKKINDVINQALKNSIGNKFTAQQIDRGDLQTSRTQNLGINLKDNENDNNYKRIDYTNKDIGKIINKMSGAEHIQDERLLRCVISGFGYLYRQDDDTKTDKWNKQRGEDQQIIADLFSKGKIKTIIATDAIGIGVNLKIKNLYIVNTKKFTGTEETENPISDSSQLYNRVGRMAYKVSNIFTPEEHIVSVVNAVSANNEKYDERNVVLSNFDKISCQRYRRSFKLWSSAM